MGERFSSALRPGLSIPGPGIGRDRIWTGLLLLFLMGALVGSVVGSFSIGSAFPLSMEDDPARELLPGSFWDALLSSAQFFLLLLLSATSFLGVVLIPGLVFFRAYLLSCSVSALFAGASFRGLWLALLLRGVPALVTIPCFLMAAARAFQGALRLARLRFGWDSGPEPSASLQWILLPLLAVCADALYSFYLLPLLLQRF